MVAVGDTEIPTPKYSCLCNPGLESSVLDNHSYILYHMSFILILSPCFTDSSEFSYHITILH